MILADSLSTTNPLLFMLYLFFVFIFIMIFVQCLIDLFADHGESGWAKAAWVLAFVIALPLTVFVYLIVRGGSMAERNMERQKQANQQFAEMVQSSAGSGSADQIAKGKELLDAGVITQAEFDAIKTKALN
ncbi:MAG TPA: SHOCT domain-containing protein [Acidimicrobiales bacterium]